MKNKIKQLALLTMISLVSFSFHTVVELPDRKEVIVAAWERAKAYTKEYLDIATIKNLDESKLGNTVKMFNRWDTTLEDGLNKAFEHQTHHRGQTTVYLRLKGIKPPQEKLF